MFNTRAAMLRVASLTLLLLSLTLPLCTAYTLPSLSVPRDTQAAVMGDWIVFAAGDMYVLAFRPTPVAQDRAISHLLHPSVSWGVDGRREAADALHRHSTALCL